MVGPAHAPDKKPLRAVAKLRQLLFPVFRAAGSRIQKIWTARPTRAWLGIFIARELVSYGGIGSYQRTGKLGSEGALLGQKRSLVRFSWQLVSGPSTASISIGFRFG